MSLDISELIQYEEMMERVDFVRNGHYKPGNKPVSDQPDFFTMHCWEELDNLDAEEEAGDTKESNGNEITPVDEAINIPTILSEVSQSPVIVEEEATNTFAALPEAVHSPIVVKDDEDWAAYLFEDTEEAPVDEDQSSFLDQKTQLIDQTDASTTHTASPIDSTPKSNQALSLELGSEHMIRDGDFEDALKMLGCQVDESFQAQDETPTQLSKSRRQFKDFPKYSAQESLGCDIQNLVQEVEQPFHQAKELIHVIEKQVPQVEAAYQADYNMQQDQQAHLSNVEKHPIRPVDAAQQVNKLVVDTEQVVPQMQSQISLETVSDFRAYNEPEFMDGVLTHKLNEQSYIVPQEQSQHGLAGLFGLTLDQAKSGMRNKKAGARNTVIEKPKPATTHSLPQYAGVKKSKSTKAKVTASPNRVQTEEEKSRTGLATLLAGQQVIKNPVVATPAKKSLPAHVTEEQMATILKVASARTRPLWHRAVQEGIWNAQQQTMNLRALQTASLPSGQQALYTSPDKSAQLGPYYLQQQALPTLQVEHTDQNAGHTLQQHVGQVVDYIPSTYENQADSDNLQQHGAYLTPSRSPMEGNQGFTYNTPQGTQIDPFYHTVQEIQGVSYPSPQVTPQPVAKASSYGPPNNVSQGVGQQSPNAHHMATFNAPQQSTNMGIYPDQQQAWQFTQQGQQFQPQAYYQPPQQTQQPVRYYSPIPAPQKNVHFPQYDPQNQAQIVAQQHRIQQNQIHHQQLQQSGMQYQPTMQDNLNYNAKMVAQANAGSPKRQYTVEDFVNQRH